MAGTALMAALSTILLLLGTFIPVNTLFFTAMAAYFIGYSINKYGLKYGGIQLAACVLLDLFLNPNKIHWGLYLCFGSYIFLSEVIFLKWNHIGEGKKKLRVQLLFNWILFNGIDIPVLIFFQNLLPDWNLPGGIAVFWVLGQIGWIIYDKAYRAFIGILQERGT